MQPPADTSILLVDDRPENLLALEASLDGLGYHLTKAASGAEALKCLLQQEFAAIILDVQMPHLDGFETALLIRARERSADTPIIFLTAVYQSDEHVERGYAVGAMDYLMKPVPTTVLRAKIAALVKGWERLQEDLVQRKQAESEAQVRARQQAVVAELGQQALAGCGLQALLEQATARVAEMLAVEYCKVLELLPGGEALLLRAGVGWRAGLVGQATVGAGTDSQAGYTLRAAEAVIVDDLRTETRFSIPPLLHEHGVVSGITVIIQGEDGPWGVMGAHAMQQRAFSQVDISFLQAVANVFALTLGRMRMEADLRQRVAELADADQRKNEFLAMLGHELRNPLGAISNAILVLNQIAPAGEPVQKLRDTIDRQTQHLSRLMDDLLDVSRITYGSFELHREPVDLASVIAHGVESCRALVDECQQELSVLVPLEPISVDADVTRLEQILCNLLGNAAKYSPPGGRITVLGEREGTEAVLRVRDTGLGIAPELLPRIFDLFTQGERALDRAEGGLGLGLTLVKRLTEAHGGRVEAHSAGRGQGSEFVVRLPALPASRERRRAAPTAAVAVRPMRILVVDDNIDSAETLTDLLGLGGHAVRTVHDGLAAVDAVLADPPEVLLLDIGLPGMNGFDVARRLRAWEAQEGRESRLLIIALTGYGQEQDHERSREAGFDHHLVKPVDAKRLVGLLAAGPAAKRTPE